MLAQHAHVNLLRVWGGGLIEKEAFYNRCDELGILVWQEFILSSSGVDNFPSTDPAFIDFITGEAERIIPRRRNHPALAFWCGGNELTAEGNRPLDDSHPLLGALHDVVRRLDPDRLWLPTSPSGRVFSNSLDEIERDPTALHDVHGPWEYQGATGQQTLYNAGASLLHSEFGVEGITNLKALNETIAPEHQQPATLENPLWHHLGAWWVKAKVWRETWGDVPDTETLVRATQFAQADGLRYALEADRRRKYQNSGTLPWQFNEPYPMAACTSAVDYYGQPKPAYYAVARAYEPIHISAKFATSAWAGRDTFSAEIWANNSLDESIVGARLDATIVNLDGQVCAAKTAQVILPLDAASLLIAVDAALADIRSEVFFLDLSLTSADGGVLSRNRYSFTKAENLAPLLNVPQTTITVEQGVYTLTIRNNGEIAALFVWIEDDRPVGSPGYAYFSDNYFCLLPGESRSVTVSWQGAPPEVRRLSVRGWNTNAWQG
jgi:beta-mannosidase